MDELTLTDWLRQQPLPEDIFPLPWNLAISYMPIDVVRKKIRFMQDHFKATVDFFDMDVIAINTFAKDTQYSGTLRVRIKCGAFEQNLVGGATISTGQYTGNYHFAAIVKALATVNAFSTEYEQFGKDLNKENVIEEMIKPPVQLATSKKILKTIDKNGG